MAERLQTPGWMTIWKVDLGDDGGLPGAHWSADYKALARRTKHICFCGMHLLQSSSLIPWLCFKVALNENHFVAEMMGIL